MTRFLSSLVVLAVGVLFTACHHIDNHRLHVSYVNVTFNTQADWDYWGVSGAGLYRIYDRENNLPAGFPYTAMSATGVGGILLCTTYAAVPVAYDRACPVECNSAVRVFINEDNEAECPKCHSRYDVFEMFGHPVAGRAAELGYGLELYSVSSNSLTGGVMISK